MFITNNLIDSFFDDGFAIRKINEIKNLNFNLSRPIYIIL